MKKQFWIFVDGQRRYYDHPPEPPGHTVEQLEYAYWMALLLERSAEVSKK